MSAVKKYTVTATIQSGDLTNPPADVQWYSGDNLAKAVNALTGAATHDEDTDHGDLPVSMRYRTVSVRLDTEVLPDEPERGYTVVFDGDLPPALSNCAWWDTSAQYQPWTRVECSGRMAVVTMFHDGVPHVAALMCEGHVNAYPESNR